MSPGAVVAADTSLPLLLIEASLEATQPDPAKTREYTQRFPTWGVSLYRPGWIHIGGGQSEFFEHLRRVGAQLRGGAGDLARCSRKPRRYTREPNRAVWNVHRLEITDGVEVAIVERRCGSR